MAGRVSFLAGWVIDGSGGPIRKNVLIECVGNLICKIQNASLQDRRMPGVIDLAEYTILPPLVDSHAHLCMSGTIDEKLRKRQLETGFEDASAVIHDHIRMHLRHGVLAVRDGGDRNAFTLRYKSTCHANNTFHLHTSGRALHQKSRYGAFVGHHPPKGVSLSKYIHNMNEAVDQIKIINSGLNSLNHFGVQTPPQFSTQEILNAVNTAAKKGLDVMVHANGILPVASSIEAGCSSIEHGFFMGTDNLRRMYQLGIYWVPTACTMQAYAKVMKPNSETGRVALMNWEHQLGQIAAAKALGVKIALGTDAGSPGVNHGEAVAMELNIFMEAGYSLASAIQCATFNGWRLLGISDTGHIAKDQRATFIAIKAEPPDLLENLNDCLVYVDAQKLTI